MRNPFFTFKKGVLFFIFLSASITSSYVQAHGGVEIEKDYCTFRLSGYMLHFTAYQPELFGTEELCKSLADSEEAVLVLDFVDEKLRNMPIKVDIKKEEQAGFMTVQSFPEQLYPTGTMYIPFLKPLEGKYKVLVSLEADESKRVDNHPVAAAFSFVVSADEAFNRANFYKKNSGAILIAILMILAGLIVFKFYKNKA
jgi:hypothetical protein